MLQTTICLYMFHSVAPVTSNQNLDLGFIPRCLIMFKIQHTITTIYYMIQQCIQPHTVNLVHIYHILGKILSFDIRAVALMHGHQLPSRPDDNSHEICHMLHDRLNAKLISLLSKCKSHLTVIKLQCPTFTYMLHYKFLSLLVVLKTNNMLCDISYFGIGCRFIFCYFQQILYIICFTIGCILEFNCYNWFKVSQTCREIYYMVSIVTANKKRNIRNGLHFHRFNDMLFILFTELSKCNFIGIHQFDW